MNLNYDTNLGHEVRVNYTTNHHMPMIDRVEWCVRYLGPIGIRWNNYLCPIDCKYVIYSFKNEKDAFMFALMFV